MPRLHVVLLVLIASVCLSFLGLHLVPQRLAEPLLLPLAVALPMLLAMLGAARRPGSAGTVAGLVALLAALEAVAGGLVALRGDPLAAPTIFGLPLPAALLLLGLAAAPLPVAALLFARWLAATGPEGAPPGDAPG